MVSVSFFVLDRSSMTPSLGRVVLCSVSPLGPSVTVSMITWAECSKNVPCSHYVVTGSLIESQLLLAHSCIILTLRFVTARLSPQHSVQATVQVLITWSRIYLSMVGWDLPVYMLLVKLIGSCPVDNNRSWMYWFWASVEGLLCRPMSDVSCD